MRVSSLSGGVMQVCDEDSAAAKEALIQQVLDVSCAAAPRQAAPAVRREWLAAKCVVPQYQLARADALRALSVADDAARGGALLDAQLESDAARFAEELAAPQHLSWKASAAFGTWLEECPYATRGSLLHTVQVRLLLDAHWLTLGPAL